LDKLQESVDDNSLDLSNLSARVIMKLQLTEKILLRAVMDATEVTVPTTFIILPQKITSQSKEDGSNKAKQVGADQIIEFIDSLANSWKGLASFVGYQELYLYLIDEYTGKPVIPDANDSIYPVPIQVNADNSLLKSISPYLATGLKFISTVNSIAGMVTYLGYPVPTISLDTSIQSYIQTIADGTSVAEFSNLSSNSATISSSTDPSGTDSSDGGAVQSTRGAALRELKNFFVKKDPDGSFCQLRRVAARTGQCMWTTEENFNKMELETDDDNLISIFDLYRENDNSNDTVTAEIDDGLKQFIPAPMLPLVTVGVQTDHLLAIVEDDVHNLVEEDRVSEATANYWLFSCASCDNMWCTCI
jgi:hypothetical protein